MSEPAGLPSESLSFTAIKLFAHGAISDVSPGRATAAPRWAQAVSPAVPSVAAALSLAVLADAVTVVVSLQDDALLKLVAVRFVRSSGCLHLLDEELFI